MKLATSKLSKENNVIGMNKSTETEKNEMIKKIHLILSSQKCGGNWTASFWFGIG